MILRDGARWSGSFPVNAALAGQAVTAVTLFASDVRILSNMSDAELRDWLEVLRGRFRPSEQSL